MSSSALPERRQYMMGRQKLLQKVLIEEWFSVFWPMEHNLSDKGPNVTGEVMKNLTEQLGIGCVQTYPFHPQANEIFDFWNRTSVKDTSSFVSLGHSDWDDQVAGMYAIQHRDLRSNRHYSIKVHVRSGTIRCLRINKYSVSSGRSRRLGDEIIPPTQ